MYATITPEALNEWLLLCDDRYTTPVVFVITVIVGLGFQRNVVSGLQWKHPLVFLNTHTPTQNAIPNAVVLSLQVVVDTVNQITEEASIDGLR